MLFSFVFKLKSHPCHIHKGDDNPVAYAKHQCRRLGEEVQGRAGRAVINHFNLGSLTMSDTTIEREKTGSNGPAFCAHFKSKSQIQAHPADP